MGWECSSRLPDTQAYFGLVWESPVEGLAAFQRSQITLLVDLDQHRLLGVILKYD